MSSKRSGEVGRFAPSTTGPAHPGTLLAALLCWLDARSRGAHLILRLEDLDPQRCRPELARAMVEALAWLGLEFDETVLQSERGADHAEALDVLAAAGLLYPCCCSRSTLREETRRAPDGSPRYPGTCRGRALPAPAEGGWRGCTEALRLRLPGGWVEPASEGGPPLGQDPLASCGDPVVRRRDGAVAYTLANVVDDGRAGVTRVVRGRDLADTTATQVAIARALSLPPPRYRHHLLLLEPRGDKLAKLHGSVGIDALSARYTPEALCGLLAQASGLRPGAEPTTPQALLDGFRWEEVRSRDRELRWEEGSLRLGP